MPTNQNFLSTVAVNIVDCVLILVHYVYVILGILQYYTLTQVVAYQCRHQALILL